jgi:hypothetical protein
MVPLARVTGSGNCEIQAEKAEDFFHWASRPRALCASACVGTTLNEEAGSGGRSRREKHFLAPSVRRVGGRGVVRCGEARRFSVAAICKVSYDSGAGALSFSDCFPPATPASCAIPAEPQLPQLEAGRISCAVAHENGCHHNPG